MGATNDAPRLERRLAASDRRWAAFRVAVLLALLGGLIIWQVLAARDSSYERLPALEVLSAKELLPVALQEAREWRADAFLSDALFTVVPPESTGQPEANFGFSTPSDPLVELGVTIRVFPTYLETRVEEFQHSPRSADLPIESDEWSIDSIEALEIARANGGDDFLRANPDTFSIHLILEHDRQSSGRELEWRVGFLTPAPTGIRIIIDPLTGDVREVK